MHQGHLFLELGDYGAARSCYEKVMTRRSVASNRWMIAWMLVMSGHAAWLQGEAAVTRSQMAEALRLFQPFENKAGTLAALENLVAAVLSPGPGSRATGGERAARLAGAMAAQREALGPPQPEWWLRPTRWLRFRERIEAVLRAAALEQECPAAWAEGRALSLEQAVAFALEESEIPDTDGEDQ